MSTEGLRAESGVDGEVSRAVSTGGGDCEAVSTLRGFRSDVDRRFAAASTRGFSERRAGLIEGVCRAVSTRGFAEWRAVLTEGVSGAVLTVGVPERKAVSREWGCVGSVSVMFVLLLSCGGVVLKKNKICRKMD